MRATAAGGMRLGAVQPAGLLFSGDSFCLQSVRHATKKAGGSTKNGRDSPGQRLGVKKFGGEVVEPGNIVIRQRGSKFKAGDSMKMGKDHTIYAVASGWVRFTYDKLRRRSTVHVASTPPANVPLPRGYIAATEAAAATAAAAVSA
jgi:large subunit ribosomal protein L27